MSDVHQSTVVPDTPAVDTTATSTSETKMEETPRAEPITEAPIAESMMKPTEPEIATEPKDEIAPIEGKTESAAAPEKKAVEPITQGQLALKGPGLLKSIIPSKKEFWLSDDAVSPQDLNSYMRGEKPEVAHAVVAWASQSGKGLLFFNKKGDTSRKTPGHVLALYDAVDLKKESPHEIAFKLNGQELVLKAASDNERDGWYLSIEKAIEIGKAQKDEVRESEGYKAEMEKLNKPTVSAATIAAKQRSQSQPKKSTDVDRSEAQRKNSDLESEEKKDKKSRSASRGVLDRLKSKKEPETKKEEPGTVEEPKAEDNKTEDLVGAGAGTAGLVGGAAAVNGVTSTDNEEKKDETVESPVETKTEDKSKPAKRGSIFGKMQGWSNMKSPAKEREQKDAELKPDVPPKDDVVAASPPQLPETTTTEPTETEAQPETVDKKDELTTPSKERPGFLSGFSFGNKRNRSVSPSTPMQEPAKTEDAALVEAPKESAPVEEAKVEEPTAEPTTVEPVTAEEPAKTDAAKTDSTPNKRQSVLGNLGRRASKAFRGIQTPKKENTAPTTQPKEEITEAPKTVEEPTTNGDSKPAAAQPQQIGDVVPDAIEVGKAEHQPAVVAASA